MKIIFFILTIISLTIFGGGCGTMQFQSNEKLEDKVVVLETLQESPKSNFQDFKVGDDVAVIGANGVLDVSGKVEEITGKIVYAASPSLSRKGNEIWMPVERAINLKGNEKTFAKGYKVRTGEGRFIKSEWFPPPQVFYAPWANTAKLKVGDTVYKNHFGDFPSDKGVITELPVNENGQFRVRFDGMEKDESVERAKLFSSTETASNEKLAIGEIVYFDQLYWAIIVGKQDGNIIIREAGFPPKDKLVDASKLQILK